MNKTYFNWMALAAAGFMPAVGARGQEAVRMSEASEQAATARQQNARAFGYYNLQAGPTAWNFNAGTAFVACDNILYSSANKEADVIVRPEIDAHGILPLSGVNTLTLGLGLGYAAYVTHSEHDTPFVAPGTELSFDVYSGNLWINFHDRFSIQDNSFVDPTYAGTGDYQLLQNVLGASFVWDLDRIMLKWGFDYNDHQALTGDLIIRDGATEIFSASGSYELRRRLRAGLETGGGFLSYNAQLPSTNNTGTVNTTGDFTQWSAGPFTEWSLTEHINMRAGVGYTVTAPTEPTPLGKTLEGVYFRASVNHQANQYLQYGLSGGRDLSFSTYGGNQDAYSVGVNAFWDVSRRTKLNASFSYYNGTTGYLTGGGLRPEAFDWYAPSVGAQWKVTSRLTADLAYHYYSRGSSTASYEVNVASLNLRYRF
ncbi:MAG: hypothetical protein ACLQVX_18825 [Limisphaerales bacterium]